MRVVAWVLVPVTHGHSGQLDTWHCLLPCCIFVYVKLLVNTISQINKNMFFMPLHVMFDVQKKLITEPQYHLVDHQNGRITYSII